MAAKKKNDAAPLRGSKGEGRLALTEGVIEQLLGRLRRVEGQIQAIQRMISERRDCHAIAQQMAAARGALDRATVQLMTSSMAQCLRPNGQVDNDELERLSEIFVKLLS